MSELHLEQSGEDALLWIKAVPGASRDEVAGILGDRLKVRISAAAEGGKANSAICNVLARTLGIKPRDIVIVAGQTNAEKSVRICGMSTTRVRECLL